jgi:hypothetical protein
MALSEFREVIGDFSDELKEAGYGTEGGMGRGRGAPIDADVLFYMKLAETTRCRCGRRHWRRREPFTPTPMLRGRWDRRPGGSPKAGHRTPEELKQALLAAQEIYYADPKVATAGAYLMFGETISTLPLKCIQRCILLKVGISI